MIGGILASKCRDKSAFLEQPTQILMLCSCHTLVVHNRYEGRLEVTARHYADSEIKLGDEFRCRWLARICKHSFDMRRHTCLSFAGR